jgi:hypothetical protein
MFAPSSSDDDGASRDDCGAHLETLTRLACQAQTLVADLLFAADAQDATFQLDRHPERADALFDFEYLRRPSACDARLSASPDLRRVDETCRAACRSSVWRAYRSLANVVRWRTSFVAFCESLRERDEKKRFGDASSDESDAGFVDRSYDSDTRHDVTDESENERDEGDFGGDVVDDRTPGRDGDGRLTRRARRKEEPREKNKHDAPRAAPSFRAASRDFRFRQMIRELVSLFASALLIVETRLEAPFLERVVVQRARWSEEEAKAEREATSSKNQVAFDPPEWDDVVALVATKTTKSDRSGSSRCLRARPVPGAGAFAQFGLPDFVVELVVRSGGVVSAPQARADCGKTWQRTTRRMTLAAREKFARVFFSRRRRSVRTTGTCATSSTRTSPTRSSCFCLQRGHSSSTLPPPGSRSKPPGARSRVRALSRSRVQRRLCLPHPAFYRDVRETDFRETYFRTRERTAVRSRICPRICRTRIPPPPAHSSRTRVGAPPRQTWWLSARRV